MADNPAAPEGATTWDAGVAVVSLPDFYLVGGNDTALRFLGLGTADLPSPAQRWLAADDAGLVHSNIVPTLRSDRVWSGELRFVAVGAGVFGLPVMVVPQPNVGAEPSQATLIVASDRTSTAWAGVPDPLTGLPTRGVLIDRLTNALNRSERDSHLLASLFVDLDSLKEVNDQYGHDVGDATLVAAGRRIRSCLRAGDTVARFGGDEFVVLCEALDDEEQARDVADRIIESLGDAASDHPIGASVGISFARGSDVDAHELIGRADTAMYRAKARGGGRVEVFDREMQARQEADDALRGRLVDAITNDSLTVAGQAIFELQTGRVVGVELFIRVRDQARAVISAGDVLRLARKHSEAIDTAVIGRALGLVRGWRRSLGADAPRLHVNLSAQSLASEHFAGRITSAFAAAHIEPRSVALEIAGPDIARATDRHLETIAVLRRTGFLIVVDGYGASPVSLRLVASLQPSMVKIAGLERNNGSPVPHSVVAALIRATVGLGISTCVKGIESRPMLDAVVAAGAFAGQGNALSAVGSLDRVNALLTGPPRLGF